MTVLPSTHNSPETAFVIDDYPFGRTVRCFKRMWVETADTGAKKGLQRICYQTTKKSINHIKDEYPSAPMDKSYLWNKVKPGVYGRLCIMFVDPETGHIECDGLGEYAWETHVTQFRLKYGKKLDDRQTARLNAIN